MKFFQPLGEKTRPLPLSRTDGKNAGRPRTFFRLKTGEKNAMI